MLAREGANVIVIRDGQTIAETGGDYGDGGFIYQDLYDLPDFGGGRPVIGGWIVDGEPAGMGVREDGLDHREPRQVRAARLRRLNRED